MSHQPNNVSAPFSNCRFQICDLPGQCVGEGKCHHPAVAAASAQASDQTELIRALQKALFYWMPRCAGEDSPWGTKAAEHAYLLIGLDDNSTECWGDHMLEYVGIMNRQQEKLEIVLRDAGCEDEADHIEFIQKLSDRAAASERTDFEWPPLPSFPKPFLDSEKSGAVFTEHQMQGYANAYGELVRATASAQATGQAVDDALTRELLETLQMMVKHFTQTPSTLADSTARGKAHEVIAKAYAAIGYAAPYPAAREAGDGVTLTDRIIAAIEGECDGLAITSEQASSILAYLQYGAPMDEAQAIQRDASRYRKLRSADIDAIHKGGVFAGLTPDNVVINGEDLDIAVDLLIDDAALLREAGSR